MVDQELPLFAVPPLHDDCSVVSIDQMNEVGTSTVSSDVAKKGPRPPPPQLHCHYLGNFLGRVDLVPWQGFYSYYSSFFFSVSLVGALALVAISLI